ncbi:MAG: polysaccharide deacetylase family protein [Lachnospiraceae bacterium]|nr:polysaccharide deacetylase family protein [Lachnospiraceae bacterium]
MKGRTGEIKFLFPEGKDKALTFSYDDAQIYDRRLVSIFNQHNMKATFHLNSGTLDREGFITTAEVKELYVNHEVACHAVSHPFFNQLSKMQMIAEIYEDRRALERCLGKIVRGMSYPFGEYNEQMIQTAVNLGIVYSRTVESTMNFSLPADFMKWHPTCHHSGVTDTMIEDFLNAPNYRNLSLFYIWGHSYEFEENHNWEQISGICERLQGKEDVWYATNIEIYEYVTAMRSIVVSADEDLIYNPTAVTLYLRIDNRTIILPPGAVQSITE